jgi:hypothetical protein
MTIMSPGQPELPLGVGCETAPITESDPFLNFPKLEKHVSFDPELQYHEIEGNRSNQGRRVTRRVHILGLLSLFFGFLIFTHAWKVSEPDSDLYIISQIQHPYRHHPHTTMCSSTANHKTATFTFNGIDQFSLNEFLDTGGYFLLDIRGTITLRSVVSQDAAVVVDLSMTSYNIEMGDPHYDHSPASLTISTPELKNKSFLRRPYIDLQITVHVKPGVKLETFGVETRHLHIEIDSSLDLAVSDKTTLAAVSGHVNSPTAPAEFTSREKYIRSVSGGIRGSYSLEDVLSVSTASGGIRIFVLPKEAGEVVAPASFSARSGSGHVDVQFETFGAPNRNYRVDVHAGSGGVSGTYIHGSRTSIASGSGSKRISVVPFDGSGGELVTEGGSGSNDVAVLRPLRESKTLGPLRSNHRSVSGGLRLSYPREWAGRFEGSSVSGHLSAEGPGLEVDGGGGAGLKRVSGRSKMEGMAELSFSSVSGGARLVVG